MPKLKLDLANIKVESFETNERIPENGSVIAQEAAYTITICENQLPNCYHLDPTFDGDTCPDTCNIDLCNWNASLVPTCNNPYGGGPTCVAPGYCT